MAKGLPSPAEPDGKSPYLMVSLVAGGVQYFRDPPKG